jgi:hypothetical protein
MGAVNRKCGLGAQKWKAVYRSVTCDIQAGIKPSHLTNTDCREKNLGRLVGRTYQTGCRWRRVMKVTIELQIYNNQEQPEGSVLIVARPDGFGEANHIDLMVKDECFELDADDILAAITRATAKVAK